MAQKMAGADEGKAALAPEFQKFHVMLSARFSGDQEKLLSFVQSVQEKYQSLRYNDAGGKQISAKEAGLNEAAFGYAMVAFENARGTKAALPSAKGFSSFQGAVFSAKSFAVYDMDNAKGKNQFFLVDVGLNAITVASKSTFSAASGKSEIKKVGQTGQTMPYGVMALVGEREKNYSAYLFGQEKVNLLVGGAIPKRLHAGAEYAGSESKGCIMITKGSYLAAKKATNGFGMGVQGAASEATMLYSHSSTAIDASGSTAFFKYAKESKMMSLDFLESLNIANNKIGVYPGFYE